MGHWKRYFVLARLHWGQFFNLTGLKAELKGTYSVICLCLCRCFIITTLLNPEKRDSEL